MSIKYAELQKHKQSIAKLDNVISAMRGVAAARLQQCQLQLDNLDDYSNTITHAISQVIELLPPTLSDQKRPIHTTSGLVLFCAEYGFSGTFTEKIFDHVIEKLSQAKLLVIGSRGIQLSQARGLSVTWRTPMMTNLNNANAVADQIHQELYRQINMHHVSHIELIYAKPQSQKIEIVPQALFPIDYARFTAISQAPPPLLHLNPKSLLEWLAHEYLYAQITQALIYTYAAENSARLQTMSAAHENIKKKLATLTLEEQLARQSEITDEIIEIASGARNLNGPF
jgi:F-type H+-transporting ATPase subunit gamma